MSDTVLEIRHFQPDRLYRADDPELTIVGTVKTMRLWRHQGRGPDYLKFGRRVLYLGRDLNSFMAARLLKPAAA